MKKTIKSVFQRRGQIKKTVYVAMSGGVDSSVAAALLKKRGYKVIGVFMRPWQPWPGLCMWQGDREDAMRAASVLGIPLLTWDFSREYKKEVGDYMIREYKAGRTPNPDVMCNRHIKFGIFLEKALKAGADYIATGHYIRLMWKSQITNNPFDRLRVLSLSKDKSQTNSKFKILNSKFRLFQAKDKNKDQSYFLWTLTQKQLKYCLFPIGDYVKPEVRKMAKKFGLPNHDKKDSQGVCFIGPLDMKNFLTRYIKNKKGEIWAVDEANPSTHSTKPQGGEPVESTSSGRPNYKVIGSHDGIYYYTIGQRHGLDIKNGQGPYYVIGKDIKRNIIYVANKETRDKGQETSVTVKKVNWIGKQPELPIKLDIKIRYRSESVPVTFSKINSGYCATALPRYKLSSITPGQSAVFYLPRRSSKAKVGKGQELLGGGIIT